MGVTRCRVNAAAKCGTARYRYYVDRRGIPQFPPLRATAHGTECCDRCKHVILGRVAQERGVSVGGQRRFAL